MNIKEAKKQIKNTVLTYLSKNEFNEYEIPLHKQRPIFLLGTPGIGKTAVMEQISQELNIGFVSYSMTHHTRQSALGLPFISEKSYDGKTYRISEYTMSEIIASVYEKMEQTGVREGILFLDEINCVSETLAPAMLQFLQYKVFGQHQIPEGWIITTAGNPPEFNRSVREFDIATLDRLKMINVEADYPAWREYALTAGVHTSIISYLDLKKDDFYQIQTTVEGKQIVTPRAWEDLSDSIKLCEKLRLEIDEAMVGQYLQCPRIAKDFTIYYDLFNKYKSDYQIEEIFHGNWNSQLEEKSRQARLDERISFVNLLLDGIFSTVKGCNITQEALQQVTSILTQIKNSPVCTTSCSSLLLSAIEKEEQAFQKQAGSGMLSDRRKLIFRRTLGYLESYHTSLIARELQDFNALKELFEKDTALFKSQVHEIQQMLDHVFRFIENAFGADNEILILVSSLTGNQDTADFISKFGCDKYFEHSKDLLFYERQQEIETQLKDISL